MCVFLHPKPSFSLTLVKDSSILAVVRVPEHAVFAGIQVDAVKLENTISYTLICFFRCKVVGRKYFSSVSEF